MLTINSTKTLTIKGARPTNTIPNNKDTRKNKSLSGTELTLSLIGLAVLGTASVILGKGKLSVMTYEEALKKNGLAMKEGFIINIKSGEKYSGKLNRNIDINKKESLLFKNGQLKEKLYYNALGKELNGEFYKDGELIISVGEHQGIISKSFPFRRYSDGKIIEKGDVFHQNISSVFQWARDSLQ